MQETFNIPPARDKLLFTPGPLTTSLTVKQAMLNDAGSWHGDFNGLVDTIRERLLKLAGVSRAEGWELVPMQGSGTFAVEAVFQTCVPPRGKVAVLANGAYGERMIEMLRLAGIEHLPIRFAEDAPCDPAELEKQLGADPAVTHVAVVHCETTTGLLNPIEAIGAIVRARGKIFIVDAMSSFGGMPIDFAACGMDFLISSANKCIEGVPGFACVFCRRSVLEEHGRHARSLSLDLLRQLRGFESEGKFRYTPPTHSILAFDRALQELEMEGGIVARNLRYRRNQEVLLRGMRRLGFQTYLKPEIQGPFITAFRYRPERYFDFERLYVGLSERGFIIYPGKLTAVNTFRIANVGRLFPADMEQLVKAIETVMAKMSA